jgi:two-component system, OmpR family, phosphate regulon sensor histidine kinase PhoR
MCSLSFKKKIFLSEIVLFFIFLAVIAILIGSGVKITFRNSLKAQTNDLVEEVSKASNYEKMLEMLKNKKNDVFFRVTLTDENFNRLYDSHLEKSLLETNTTYLKNSEVIQQALKKNIGYKEAYSEVFLQNFAFVAKKFNLLGKIYILRTDFPLKEIDEVRKDFEIGLLTFGTLILLLYTAMTWIITNRLISPIQQIIKTIKPYLEKKQKFLPTIKLEKTLGVKDDFSHLVNVLNLLSLNIQKHIQAITDQRNETKAILESLMEGIISLDEKNVITFINEKACEMLSQKKENLLFCDVTKIKNHSNEILDKCLELKNIVNKYNNVASKQVLIDVEKGCLIDIIGVSKDKKNGILLVLQDRTADYKMLKMGKEFVTNASHELKTPITIIKGFAETLLNHPNRDENLVNEVTSKILKTSNRLANLVHNLLLLAEVDNTYDSNFIECDLNDLLENAIAMHYCSKNKVNINFSRNLESLNVYAQPYLLELAIRNLLENAIKYSDKNVDIDVSVKCFDNCYQINIADKGIGIPKNEIEHIFDRFYTVDKARSKKFGGTGLGLSIVKNIITKHSGKIVAKSNLNVGSEFIIDLPHHKNTL